MAEGEERRSTEEEEEEEEAAAEADAMMSRGAERLEKRESKREKEGIERVQVHEKKGRWGDELGRGKQWMLAFYASAEAIGTLRTLMDRP